MNSKLEYGKTRNGLIAHIWRHQRWNSKVKGRPLPSYSRVEFKRWLASQGLSRLYRAWKESGFDKWMRPSVDRIDSKLTYKFGNIELVTWRENRDRQTRDIIAGYGPSGARCKPVMMVDEDGKETRFPSIASASRSVGWSVKTQIKKGIVDRLGRRFYLIEKGEEA